MANFEDNERPDLQDLVAYLEGRGSAALRARVLKRLDEDESYLELMADLAPLLREDGAEGEGAAAAPAAAPVATPPRHLVAVPPATPAATPATTPAATPAPSLPGKVVALPSPYRKRRVLIAAMAALVPISVSIWLLGQSRVSTASLAANRLNPTQATLDDHPWGETYRGGVAATEEDPAMYQAGGLLVDLETALKKEWPIQSKSRLSLLATTLDRQLFEASGLASVEKSVQAGAFRAAAAKAEEAYKYLAEDKYSAHYLEQGACIRATLLASTGPDYRSFLEDQRLRRRCFDFLKDDWGAATERLQDLLVEAAPKPAEDLDGR